MSAATVKLADAQHVIARSYGFEFVVRAARRGQAAPHRPSSSARGCPTDPERRLDLVFEAIEQNDVARIQLLLKLDASLAKGRGERRPLAHAVQFDRGESGRPSGRRWSPTDGRLWPST